MIELNLLPKELRKKKKKKRKQKTQPKVTAVPDIKFSKVPFLPLSIGALILLILLHFFFILLSNNKSELFKSLEKKWNEGATQRDKAKEVTDNIEYLQKRLNVARKIVKPDLDLAGLLSGLNQAVIPNIWLSEMELRFSRKKSSTEGEIPESLEILGYALGKSEQATSLVAKFMSSLKQQSEFSRYFDDIELSVMRNAAVAEQEVMMFELNCRFKKTEIIVKDPEKVEKKRRRKRR